MGPDSLPVGSVTAMQDGFPETPADSTPDSDGVLLPGELMRRDRIHRALQTRFRPAGVRTRPKLVLGVSTFNRLEYLSHIVETFAVTRSDEFEWTLIVADDGSTDGSWEFLTSYEPDGFGLIAIRNNAARIAGQTNTIFKAAQAVGFDFGFKADDDVFFDRPGWDHLYYQAWARSGFDHLVYHNPAWKPRQHLLRRPNLASSTDVFDSMGCFFTFTPRLLDTVGWFDEVNFPVRGNSHIDFTMRACRAGFNEANTLWDADGSTDLVLMWEREGYVDLTDWKSPEIQALVSPDEKARRLAVINSPDRIRVTEVDATDRTGRVAAVAAGANQLECQLALEASGKFWIPGSVNIDYDTVFVLNLADDQRKWAATASQLASEGIVFQRLPAVFGGESTHLREWRYYQSQGLFRKTEVMLGRKLIQSPGAWGYLKSMQGALEAARTGRLRSFILFDDDIRLHNEFLERYRHVRTQMKEAPLLFFLGCTQREWDEVEFLSENTYPADQYLDGSFAVGISGNLYSELLDEVAEFVAPFDSGALRAAIRNHPDRSVVAFPNLVIPDVEHSYIRQSRDIEEHAATARWDLGSYVEREAAVPRRLTTEELITVVIPALDAPVIGLLDTMASVGGQSYGKLEVLVGVRDDASDIRFIQELPMKDPRVTLFLFDDDIGTPEATNLMLSAASGQHVALVPAGTIAAPNRLADAIEDMSDDADVSRSLLAVCSAHPAGSGRGVRHLDSWVETFGERSEVVVDLISRRLIDLVGGVRLEGELGFTELVDRAGTVTDVKVVDAGTTRSVRAHDLVRVPGSQPWDHFEELLTDGSIPPYVPLKSSPIRYSVVVTGNS